MSDANQNTNALHQGYSAGLRNTAGLFGAGNGNGMAIGDWQPMSTAPRDGTPVELRCTYGVAPWYGLFSWTDEAMVSVTICHSDGTQTHEPRQLHKVTPGWHDASGQGVSDEQYLTWRPYSGNAGGYVDPTGGLQDNPAYWRAAVAAKYGLPPDAYEKTAERNERKNKERERPPVPLKAEVAEKPRRVWWWFGRR